MGSRGHPAHKGDWRARYAVAASLRFPRRTPGERLCSGCLAERSSRKRVYMFFMLCQGWHCQFLEEDLNTPLPVN